VYGGVLKLRTAEDQSERIKQLKMTANTAAARNPQSKRFSTAFRVEAVRIIEAGRSVKQLARELGVSTWSLRQWKKRYGAGVSSGGRSPQGAHGGAATTTVALADELAQVKAELYAVSRQRDILKKALAILGQESLSAIV
jgi:transposase-like protein